MTFTVIFTAVVITGIFVLMTLGLRKKKFKGYAKTGFFEFGIETED